MKYKEVREELRDTIAELQAMGAEIEQIWRWCEEMLTLGSREKGWGNFIVSQEVRKQKRKDNKRMDAWEGFERVQVAEK